MATVSVRYIVDDVDSAIAFYCLHLGVYRGDAPGADVRDPAPRRPPPPAPGVGGRQILLDDPSGNPVELFEPYR